MPGLKRDFPYDPTSFKNVWVYIETLEGKPAEVGFELLGKGRELAEKLGSGLCAVVLGHEIENLPEELFEYGADKVYILNNPLFSHYRSQAYTLGLLEVMRKYLPDVVLFGATEEGRDLAGAIASEIFGGLTADCTGLDIDDTTKSLVSTRPAFGGNIMASIKCPMDKPQMSTVRPRVFTRQVRERGRRGEVIREQPGFSEADINAKIIKFTPADQDDFIDLGRSEIIVAGGRGVGSKEGFKKLRKLADLLGGEVGASRGAVDSGYIEYAHQVGQTGQTVRPKVYFAFGISGAIQHIVGMKGSDRVIAVNQDPDAPIFRNCDYGIVDDLFRVIDEMIHAFESGNGVGWLKAAGIPAISGE